MRGSSQYDLIVEGVGDKVSMGSQNSVSDEYRSVRRKVFDAYHPAELPKDGSSCSYGGPPATDEERAVARILHWLRMKKKSKAWSIEMSCIPSPKGWKTQKHGVWVPNYKEACDANVQTAIPYTTKSGHGTCRMVPFAWWDHCKTYEHCLFLAQRRKPYVSQLIDPDRTARGHTIYRLSSMAAALCLGCVPVLAADQDLLVRLFFKEWCAGNIPGVHEEKEATCLEKTASV